MLFETCPNLKYCVVSLLELYTQLCLQAVSTSTLRLFARMTGVEIGSDSLAPRF